MEIAGRLVGAGQPCFVIAEAGVNHDGDVRKAVALVNAAADAGADAVKFQTFDADRLVTESAPAAKYQSEGTAREESQRDLLRRLELGPDDHRTIQQECRRRGIAFLSTPFDEASADFLETLDMAAYKVPSGEITNIPYLEHIARKNRPVLLSTGMSTLEEVSVAVSTLRHSGVEQLVILHCVSEYPASAASANLRAMLTMRDAFHTVAGYSDHTLGIDVALASVALGAQVLEKHLTLDCSAVGPDHRASLEPTEFGALVRGTRAIESSLGTGVKAPTTQELENALIVRKSIVATQSLEAGTVVTRQSIAIKRPGTGAPPSMLVEVVGRRLAVSVPAGTPIRLDMLR